MSEIRSVWSSTIEEPPSCVAFCPQRPEYIVIGTYLLHGQAESISPGEKQVRSGTLNLYRCQDSSLHHSQTIALTSASLDLDWSPHVAEHGDLLVVATSTGSLEFYKLQNDQLTLVNKQQVSEADVLVLDVVWHPSLANIIGITLSTGEVAMCSIDSGSQWSDSLEWKLDIVTTHTLEPWTLAFSLAGHQILSGGDDMVLQCCAVDDLEAPINAWRNRKQHLAGVTSILPLSADLCLTGSYDDHIRLLSMPVQGSRSVLAELNLGGGVWRMKLLDVKNRSSGGLASRSYTILASCMHAGARIVELKQEQTDSLELDGDVTAGDWHFEVRGKFVEHESMNYGSDTQPRHGSDRFTIVSSSFYDRRICLWQYDELKQRIE